MLNVALDVANGPLRCVIVLNVIMLSVVASTYDLKKIFGCTIYSS